MPRLQHVGRGTNAPLGTLWYNRGRRVIAHHWCPLAWLLFCIACALNALLFGNFCLVQHGLQRAKSECADRKSTRLNSSHVSISYAVFCLKKKKSNNQRPAHVDR